MACEGGLSQTFTILLQSRLPKKIASLGCSTRVTNRRENMKKPDWSALLRTGLILTAIAAPVFAQTPPPPPTAVSPYTLSVFATSPSGLSAPDSVAVLGDRVFIGYGDGHDPGGADG